MGRAMSNKLVIRRLESRLKDARGLIGFHSDLTGDERGRRYEVDALNRGAVVLAVAAWDAFVEDLARDNSLTLARRLRSPASLPSEVRKSLLVWLHESVPEGARRRSRAARRRAAIEPLSRKR